MPTCPIHPHVTLRCPACTGSMGGKVRTPKKARAARKSGKLGGRPKQQR
jgi:hypothetical protein